MTAVVLANSDLALYSDPEQFVLLPRVMSLTPSHRAYQGTTVRFVGDSLPTSFRGEGRGGSLTVMARYLDVEQQDLADALKLIDTAANAADSRLFLRTNFGQVGGLDFAGAVAVFEPRISPQRGLYIDLTLECTPVAYDESVS